VLGGIAPVLLDKRYSASIFAALYAGCACIALYVFAPGDLSSLAFISLALFCVLGEAPSSALIPMLIAGLFRESAFHVVWFVIARSLARKETLTLAVGFLAAFLIEYVAVRHFFPGPLRSGYVSIHEMLLGGGVISLTSFGSLGLAIALVLGYFMQCNPTDWQGRFFLYNCYAFPAWLLFYRFFGGNLSEFRLLLPCLLPVLVGYSYDFTISESQHCNQSHQSYSPR
jgi:hypothetical protein